MLNFTAAYFTKFSLFFLLALLPFASFPQQKTSESSVLKKKVSFSYSEKALEEIFTELEEKAGISFFYIEEHVNPYTKISANSDNLTLEDALNNLLKNTELSWFLVDQYVVISQKKLEEEIQIDSSRKVEAEISPDSSEVNRYSEVYLSQFSSNKEQALGKAVYKVYLKKKKHLWFSQNLQNRQLPKDSMYVIVQDSVITDTLPSGLVSQTKIKKRKKVYVAGSRELKKEPVWAFSARISFGRTRWNAKVNNESQIKNFDKSNEYSSNSRYTAFEANLYYFYKKRFVAGTGISLKRLFKNGTYTGFYQNNFYPEEDAIKVSESYNYNYLYLNIPIEVGIKLPLKKISASFIAGFETSFFLNSNQDYYPVYQTQYFSNVIPGSTNNPLSSYYFDENYNRIRPEETSFRSVDFTVYFRPEILIAVTRSSYLGLSPKAFFNTSSVYSSDAPVSEIPRGFSINFTYYYFL